jgi:ElaB/YqjD/DUF883 family membrane-anchored ribosome-binding protein
MPDEKIDQKRSVGAEHEPTSIQQQHVVDAVDDSFPASDPPSGSMSASKSVAAQHDLDALHEALAPLDQGLGSMSGNTIQSGAEQAASLARDLYQRSQPYLEQGRRNLPEATGYFRQGAKAMSRLVQQHPLVTAVAVGLLGGALGWMLGRQRAGAAPTVQWRRGFNRRPKDRPIGQTRHYSAHGRAEAASHTNNSF